MQGPSTSFITASLFNTLETFALWGSKRANVAPLHPRFLSWPPLNQRNFDMANVKERIFSEEKVPVGAATTPMMSSMMGRTQLGFLNSKMVGVAVKRVPSSYYVKQGYMDCEPSWFIDNPGLMRFTEKKSASGSGLVFMKCPLDTIHSPNEMHYPVGDRGVRHITVDDVKDAWNNFFGTPELPPNLFCHEENGKTLEPPVDFENVRATTGFANLLTTVDATFSHLKNPVEDLPKLLGHLTARLRVLLDLPKFFFKPNSLESGFLLACLYTQVLIGGLSMPQVDGQGRVLSAILSLYRMKPALSMDGFKSNWRKVKGYELFKPLPPSAPLVVGQGYDMDFVSLLKVGKGQCLTVFDQKVCQHLSQKLQAGQTISADTSWSDITRRILSDLPKSLDEEGSVLRFTLQKSFKPQMEWLCDYLMTNYDDQLRRPPPGPQTTEGWIIGQP